MHGDLFDDATSAPTRDELAAGAVLFRGYLGAIEPAVREALDRVVAAAPFRHMTIPGGHTMSVAMTNCGDVGWVADRTGYRYDAVDPVTSQPWPRMPRLFRELATRAAAEAGYDNFAPDACLVNRYVPGAKMGLHQDRDEVNMDAPIVSVSLGLPATFQFGGVRRRDPVHKYALTHGDVLVWGGPSRLAFHGVLTLRRGTHPFMGASRINLTFRRAR